MIGAERICFSLSEPEFAFHATLKQNKPLSETLPPPRLRWRCMGLLKETYWIMQGNMRHTPPLFGLRLRTTPCVVVRFLYLVHVSRTETCWDLVRIRITPQQTNHTSEPDSSETGLMHLHTNQQMTLQSGPFV